MHLPFPAHMSSVLGNGMDKHWFSKFPLNHTYLSFQNPLKIFIFPSENFSTPSYVIVYIVYDQSTTFSLLLVQETTDSSFFWVTTSSPVDPHWCLSLRLLPKKPLEEVLNLGSVILEKRKDRKCGIASKKWRQVRGHSPNKAFCPMCGAFVTSGMCQVSHVFVCLACFPPGGVQESV